MLLFLIKLLGAIRGMIGTDIKNKAICALSDQIDENFKSFAHRAAHQDLDHLQLSLRPYICSFLLVLLIVSGALLQVIHTSEGIYSALLLEAGIFSYILFFGFRSLDEIARHLGDSLSSIFKFFVKSLCFINVGLLLAAGLGLLGKNVKACSDGIILVNEIILLGFLGSLVLVLGMLLVIPNAISYFLLYIFRWWLRLSIRTSEPFKNFLRYAGLSTLLISSVTIVLDVFIG